MTNNASLLRTLDSFISRAIGDNYGYKLVSSLDIELGAAESVVDDLIKHGRENIEETQWSTTTMMYNIYLAVSSYVDRENGFLQAAVRLKGNVSQTNVTEDLIYLENNMNITRVELLQSIRNVVHKINVNDSVQQLNLEILSDEKIVRMTNFLQLFYEKEEVLSIDGTCTKTCGDYSYVLHHRNGCFGSARDCEHVNTWLLKRLTYQHPHVDRIYTNIDEIVRGNRNKEIGRSQVSFKL